MSVFGGIFDALFGSDAPAPDPAIGQAAASSAATAGKALDWSMDVFNNYIKPRQDQLDQLQMQSARQQLMDQSAASDFAGQGRRDYTNYYRPLEIRSVNDANTYDSAGNIKQRMGLASNNVNQAATNARQQAIASLQRYGINPNSGAFAAVQSRLAQQQMLAEAGARTGAAFDTQDKAIALRAGAVATGRGLTNSAAQSLAGSTNAGSAAVAGGAQAADAAIKGTSVGSQGFGTAIQGYGTAGNIGANVYGSQLGYQAKALEQQTSFGGTLAGIGAAALMSSAKALKDRKQSLDTETVLDKVKGLKVDRWGYKGDPMLHIGPYAEDMHAKFGVGNGQMLGAGDSGGVALAGLKELNDKVDALASHVGVKVDTRRAAR